MRLKYKPQTTQYTCHYATQAIVLNSFLGTDVNDIEVARASNGGFRLGVSILWYAAMNLAKSPTSKYFPFAEEIYHFLKKEGRLPAFEEWLREIDESVRHNRDSAAREEERLRREGTIDLWEEGKPKTVPLSGEEVEKWIGHTRQSAENEIKRLNDLASRAGVSEDYQAYASFIQQEILSPLGAYTVGEGQDWSGVDNLSGGRVAHGELQGEDKVSLLTTESPSTILGFGADRRYFGWEAISMHSWLVDRLEDGKVILLDTNAPFYGHDPEVRVPPEKLAAAHGIMAFSPR